MAATEDNEDWQQKQPDLTWWQWQQHEDNEEWQRETQKRKAAEYAKEAAKETATYAKETATDAKETATTAAAKKPARSRDHESIVDDIPLAILYGKVKTRSSSSSSSSSSSTSDNAPKAKKAKTADNAQK